MKYRREGGTEGKKDERKHLFGWERERVPSATVSGPSRFLLIPFRTVRNFCFVLSHLSPFFIFSTFYFICTLAATLTSTSSFFIMFVSGRTRSRGRKPVSGKRVVGSEETKTGVTQTDLTAAEKRSRRPGDGETERERKREGKGGREVD